MKKSSPRRKAYRFSGKNPRTMPRVEITWLDACVSGGWKNIETCQREESLIECVAVGLLTRRDAKEIQIVQQASPDKVSDSLTIPTSCVKRMRRLR